MNADTETTEEKNPDEEILWRVCQASEGTGAGCLLWEMQDQSEEQEEGEG